MVRERIVKYVIVQVDAVEADGFDALLQIELLRKKQGQKIYKLGQVDVAVFISIDKAENTIDVPFASHYFVISHLNDS